MAAPDVALYERWRSTRDPEAFAEIVSRHSAMVYGTCKRVLGNPSDAEDAAQECFIELARARKSIRCSLGGWLHRVAVRRSLNLIRAERRRKRREARFMERMDTNNEVTWDDVQAHVDEAIAALPDKLREPIIYRFLEGQTQNAIARNLGISSSTVQCRLSNGIEETRKLLRKRGIVTPSTVLVFLLGKHLAAEAAPATLTAALGKLAIAGTASPATSAAGTGFTAALSKLIVQGGIAMTTKKALIWVGAVLVLSALTYTVYQRLGQIQREASRPDLNMQPPPLTAELQAKVDALRRRPVAESPPSNKPVLLAEPQPFEEVEPEDTGLRPASVSGLVRNEERKPIPGATLELVVGEGVSSGDPAEARYSAQANQDGKYRIENIDIFGDASLSASAEGYVTQRTFDSWTVSPLVLRRIEPGVDYTFDFMLSPFGSVVAGRVVDSSRAPIAGARVEVADHRGLPTDLRRKQGAMVSITDAEGRFSIDLPGKGACVLDVRKRGYGFGYFPNIRANSKRLELVLYKGGTIAGRVTTRSGNPVIGTPIQARAEQGGGDIWHGTPRGQTVRTDENGDYRIEDLPDEFTYRVTLPYKLPDYPILKETSRSPSDFVLRQEYLLVRSSYEHLHQREDISEKTGVVVRPEQVTRVDFVVDDTTQSSTVFYGRVTDADTGEPGSPIYVSAEAELVTYDKTTGDVESYVWNIGSAITAPDGTYRIEIIGLSQPTEITIGASYFTLYPTPDRSRDVTTLLVEPNESHEVNFTMPMGVTVPIRTVSRTGEPLEGISVRHVLSDPEGRLTLYGLEPNVTTQLKATAEIDRGWVTVGWTQPFIGKPGEVLPEQEVICDLSTGQVTGYFAIPEEMDLEGLVDGFASAQMALMARLYYHNGRIHAQMADVDSDASFLIMAAPPGVCSIHLYVFAENPEYQWWAFIEDVEVLPDHVTDLGEIVPNPPAL